MVVWLSRMWNWNWHRELVDRRAERCQTAYWDSSVRHGDNAVVWLVNNHALRNQPVKLGEEVVLVHI